MSQLLGYSSEQNKDPALMELGFSLEESSKQGNKRYMSECSIHEEKCSVGEEVQGWR